MLQGLYKVEFETPRRKAVGVIFAEDGRLFGGSSAFAYVGCYRQTGKAVTGFITSKRHTSDLNHPSLFDFDDVRVDFEGYSIGDFAAVEGAAAETPALGFKAVLTRIAEPSATSLCRGRPAPEI